MPRSPSHSPDQRRASRSRSRTPEKKSRRRRSNTYSRSPSPNTSKRLHIANLDESIRRRDIEDAFGKFGKLEDIWLASYPPLYGFVVYENANDAAKALSEMKSGYVRDCHIRVSVALPRNSGRGGRPPPRRYDSYRRSRSPYRGGRDDRRGGRDDRRRSRSPDRNSRRRRSRS